MHSLLESVYKRGYVSGKGVLFEEMKMSFAAIVKCKLNVGRGRCLNQKSKKPLFFKSSSKPENIVT